MFERMMTKDPVSEELIQKMLDATEGPLHAAFKKQFPDYSEELEDKFVGDLHQIITHLGSYCASQEISEENFLSCIMNFMSNDFEIDPTCSAEERYEQCQKFLNMSGEEIYQKYK